MNIERWAKLKEDKAEWDATDDEERSEWFSVLAAAWDAAAVRANGVLTSEVAPDAAKQARQAAADFAARARGIK